VAPREISNLLSGLGRELWVVTAAASEKRGGLIATFVNAASIVPEMPRVLLGLAKQHHTWELIEASGNFGLHLIGEEQLPWVWAFGSRTGRGIDKLAELSITTATTSAPLLNDALAWLDCRVETRMDIGDRTVYLAEVLAGGQRSTTLPLTVRRLVELAPPERLHELKDALLRDAAVDAAAIGAWRSGRRD